MYDIKHFHHSLRELRQINLDPSHDPHSLLRMHSLFLEIIYNLKVGDISQANELLQRMEKESFIQMDMQNCTDEADMMQFSFLPFNPLLLQSLFHLLAALCQQSLSPSSSVVHINTGLESLRRYQSQFHDDPSSSRIVLPTQHIREYIRTTWMEYMFLDLRVHILISQRHFHEAVDALKETISLFLSHELQSANPPTFLCSVYVLLASFGGSLRKAEDSIVYLDESLRMVDKGSAPSQIISLHLSSALIQSGRLEEAEKVMLMYGVKDEDDDVNLIFGAGFYFLAGLLSFHRRDFPSSRNLLSKALNMSTQTLNLDLKARILLSLAALDMEEGFHSAASSKIHSAEESLTSSGNLELLASLSLSKSYLSSLSENYEQMENMAASADTHLQKLVSMIEVASNDDIIPKLFPPNRENADLTSLQTNSTSSSSSSSSSSEKIYPHPFDVIHNGLPSSSTNSLNWEKSEDKVETNSSDYFATFLSSFRSGDRSTTPKQN